MPDTAGWLEKIMGGTASPQLKEMASLGLVPFDPPDMVAALVRLAADQSAEIAGKAQATLADLPRPVLMQAIEAHGTPGEVLEGVAARFGGDAEILVRLAAHPGLPGGLFAALCSSDQPEVLEALSRNQERLRRNYDALTSLLGNPALPDRIKGLMMEERDRQRAAMKGPAMPEEERALGEHEVKFDEVLVKDFEEEDERIPPAQRQEVQERRHKSIFQVIRTLNTGEKLILAMKGNKEARYLLARDSNKLVATKVLESPRLTDTEVEMFAKMTNVCDDLLRAIARTKEWMGKYNIVKALALNPKTPTGISLPLISKLTVRDLSLMARNRNIPEVIRSTAARLHKMRKEQRGG